MNNPQSSVAGRCVLVTGGASGIGKEIVHGFLENGASVAVLDLNVPASLNFNPQRKGPPEPFFVQGDVTDEISVEKAVQGILEQFGKIDVLVNNAGIMYKALAEDFDIGQWRRLIDINLTGPMICAKKVLPLMKSRQWGRIINISSIFALIGAETYSAYAAAKGGLLQLTKVWALEAARDGITVNAICPGWVATPMLEGFIQRIAAIHKVDRQAALEKIFTLVPQRRFLDPSEIVSVALFLASEAAKGINGAGVVIDTGLTAGMPLGLHRKIE